MSETPEDATALRRVLITGGLGGIGLACAHRFAAEGAAVFATTRDAARAAAFVADSSSTRHETIKPIVARLDSAAGIAALLGRVGNVDVLVNNAGLNRPKPFLDASIQDFDAVLDINLRSVFLLTQAVARQMVAAERAGRIVMVSSQAGTIGLPERSAYCASKHGVDGLMKAAAVDLKGTGICINSVAPTFVETDMTKQTLARDDFRKLIGHKLLTDALPTPDDIARAVCFLASPETSGMTGTTLRLDGGWTAH